MLLSPRPAATVLCSALTLVVAPLDAQDLIASADRGPAPLTLHQDSAPTREAPARAERRTRHPLGFTLSGYVETAFHTAYSTPTTEIAGRLYEHSAGEMAVNGVKLTLDRPIDPQHFGVGAHADLVVGENARVLKSTGFDIGRDRDLYQVYGTINIPTPDHNGVQVKVGRMATFLGLEVIETPLNPNVSVGNAFVYAENFTQTGVSVEHRFNSHVEAQFRVLNGWDQFRDVNSRFSYMAHVGLSPDALTNIALAAYTGPEQAFNNHATRSGVEVLASHKFGGVTTFVQGDYGHEERNDALPDPTHHANWWAGGAWLVVEHTPRIGFALRADYMNDGNAARTGGAYGIVGGMSNRLASATGTLNIHATQHLLLRPELRFDRASRKVYGGNQAQSTLGMSAVWVF